jgi:hypothetical protein
VDVSMSTLSSGNTRHLIKFTFKFTAFSAIVEGSMIDLNRCSQNNKTVALRRTDDHTGPHLRETTSGATAPLLLLDHPTTEYFPAMGLPGESVGGGRTTSNTRDSTSRDTPSACSDLRAIIRMVGSLVTSRRYTRKFLGQDRCD